MCFSPLEFYYMQPEKSTLNIQFHFSQVIRSTQSWRKNKVKLYHFFLKIPASNMILHHSLEYFQNFISTISISILCLTTGTFSMKTIYFFALLQHSDSPLEKLPFLFTANTSKPLQDLPITQFYNHHHSFRSLLQCHLLGICSWDQFMSVYICLYVRIPQTICLHQQFFSLKMWLYNSEIKVAH